MLVKMGDRGGSVSQVQKLLNAASSRLPRLSVDGIFGARTLARVLEFQKANGLQADGLVGGEAMAALQPRPPNDDRFVAQLSQLAAQAGQGLTGVGANAFVRHQRALLAPFAPTAQDRSEAPRCASAVGFGKRRLKIWRARLERRAPVRPRGRLPQRPSNRLESISTARPRALKSARASTWLHLRRVPRPLPK
jgi:peptidoglycan hydrolase-like protein with peptidoglycan-binding domain